MQSLERSSTTCRRYCLAAIALGLLAMPVQAAELFVASHDSTGVAPFPSRVQRFDSSSGQSLGTFVGSGSGGLEIAQATLFGPDGHLYVASFRTAEILRYDRTSGAFLGPFVAAGSGGLVEPGGMTFGPDGRLYVTSCATSEVLRYDGSTGNFAGVFVTAGSGGLDCAWSPEFGPDGNLYVASGESNEVLRYDGSSGAFIGVFVAAGSGGLDYPQGIAFGPDGDLYVASYSSNSVLRYDGTSGSFLGAFVAPGSGGLAGTQQLVFADDHLYVVGYESQGVHRYRASTGAFVDQLVDVGDLANESPTSIAVRSLPPLPAGPFLATAGIPGFRFKVRITGAQPIAGTGVADCLAETLCVAGAIPDRAEVLIRVVGPKPNGHLWPTLTKLTTSVVEVWIQQVASGQLRYYRLRGATPTFDELPGLFDRTGFLP